MKYEIAESNETIITHTGSVLIGSLLKHTELQERLNSVKVTEEPIITNSDCVFAYIGTLSQGKPAFEAVEEFRGDVFFADSLGIGQIPSTSIMRQRFDAAGTQFNEIITEEACRLLRNINAQVTPCYREFTALDIDVSPFDNSNTKKEGVSWTYKCFNGYSPIFAYLGEEGWCVNVEFREGSQHCQNNTPEFLGESIKNAKKATDQPILVRMDSGNDAVDNIVVMQNSETKADFIIKRNPRQESAQFQWDCAVDRGIEIKNTRDGKRIFVYELNSKLKNCPENVRIIYFVTERTSKADGQMLLVAEYEIESYYTSLKTDTATSSQIQNLYHAHGTSEQFHSEIKTDLDLERLPSGKFATNDLVLHMGVLTYNLLRLVGQESLKNNDYPPTAHKVKRRRIRTIIQNYMTIAAKLVAHAKKLWLKFGRNNPWLKSFKRIYATFA